ncbi:anhydro-N-acetylmuramic acid kinase [Flavobacteriaceae bacterium R38]|nr:anhydro-N-acetylmuramic acid kinase [Flavobacteriaceae bacterium R38]
MKDSYKVIGLMSGTSLDGLDIAYCHIFKEGDQWKFDILKTSSIDYTTDFQEKLKNTIHLTSEELFLFHNEYGSWLGDQVSSFIKTNTLEVDFISSHGHTVFHQPEKGFTLQVGSGQHLANTSGAKVICDFRTNDVALNGQGAPLVPIGDRLFFSDYDFCLNLGGISNVSFEQEGNRFAYDISPANMLLNYSIKKIGKSYDENGKLASTGKINEALLSKLNNLTYYQLPFPKSLGYEWFEENVIPLIDACDDTIENILHTSVHHISEQITTALLKVQKSGKTKVLVTGGGAKNEFLIKTLREKSNDKIDVIIPDNILIDFKEALVFAFMGVLRNRNEVNCLRSVTGAKKDSSSGVIYHPY